MCVYDVKLKVVSTVTRKVARLRGSCEIHIAPSVNISSAPWSTFEN